MLEIAQQQSSSPPPRAFEAQAQVRGAGALADFDREPIRHALIGQLQSDFPVTARILEPRFFAYAVSAHIEQRLRLQLEVDDGGRSFPHFLATFPECRHLRYLADVARFESLLRQVLRAPAISPVDLVPLALDLPAANRLSFATSPAHALLVSFWPVDRIWCAHQRADVDRLRISCRQRHFELWRQDGQDLYRRIGLADYRFRHALEMGVHLAAATASARDVQPDFDVMAALADIFRQGVVTGFVQQADAAGREGSY